MMAEKDFINYLRFASFGAERHVLGSRTVDLAGRVGIDLLLPSQLSLVLLNALSNF